LNRLGYLLSHLFFHICIVCHASLFFYQSHHFISRRMPHMGTKLYVGNLSYDTTQEAVRTLFEQAGEVTEVNLITDRDSGRPKGFGFVQMATDAQAQEAIRRFNGFNVDNRALTVNEARPREERSGGGGNRDNRNRDRY
jgi:cold-inducible RNA-binding protein